MATVSDFPRPIASTCPASWIRCEHPWRSPWDSPSSSPSCRRRDRRGPKPHGGFVEGEGVSLKNEVRKAIFRARI